MTCYINILNPLTVCVCQHKHMYTNRNYMSTCGVLLKPYWQSQASQLRYLGYFRYIDHLTDVDTYMLNNNIQYVPEHTQQE